MFSYFWNNNFFVRECCLISDLNGDVSFLTKIIYIFFLTLKVIVVNKMISLKIISQFNIENNPIFSTSNYWINQSPYQLMSHIFIIADAKTLTWTSYNFDRTHFFLILAKVIFLLTFAQISNLSICWRVTRVGLNLNFNSTHIAHSSHQSHQNH